jgi:hypothetical protein
MFFGDTLCEARCVIFSLASLTPLNFHLLTETNPSKMDKSCQKNERFHNWGQVQAAKEGHMFALVTTRAKAGGSTTPAIFVTALFDTFDEDMIKSVLIAPGTKENNLRTLIQSEPEFTYIFGQQTWMEIRDLINKKHPDWNIAEAAKKLQQERALKKWSGTQLKKSGRYHGFIFINNNNVGVGTYDLEVDAAYARDRGMADGSETSSQQPRALQCPTKAGTLPRSKTGSRLGRWISMNEDSKLFQVLNQYLP